MGTSNAFRHWLPANAAMPALARGALADMIDAWSREWFAGEPLQLLGRPVRIAEPQAELRKMAWQRCDGGLAIGVSPGGAVALGARSLDVANVSEARTSADTILLDRLGVACLDDLKRRAVALFGLPKGADWTYSDTASQGGAVHRVEIAGPSRNPVITIELSDALFAGFAKANLPPQPRRALGASAEALAALPVTLSALLGRCGLTVAELSGLAEGDVLVLDRAHDAPIPLAVNGRPAARGACVPTERGGSLALQIREALTA
jgi:flagellar motor switch/type III secretory pathway protein FliN